MPLVTRHSSLANWCDRIVTGGILFLVLFSPLAFGSVHPWAFSILELTVFLLVMVWMGKLMCLGGRQGIGLTGEAGLPLRKYLVTLALFIVFVLFQLLPLPPSWLRVLSPATFELYGTSLSGWPGEVPYATLLRAPAGGSAAPQATVPGAVILPTLEEVGKAAPVPFASPQGVPAAPLAGSRLVPEVWLPLSLAPSLTRSDLLKFGAYAALFFLVLFYPFEHQRQDSPNPYSLAQSSSAAIRFPRGETRLFRSLLWVVLLSGLLVALVGVAQSLFWNGKILWFFVPYDWGGAGRDVLARLSGPFINPDHFAGYLTLVFPLAVTGALFRSVLWPKKIEAVLRIASAIAAVILFSGILLSLSRAAWVGAILEMAILIGFMRRLPAQEQPSFLRKRGRSVFAYALAALSLLVVVSLVFVGGGGRKNLDIRLQETVLQDDVSLSGRLSLWQETIELAKDFPIFGVGLGAWPELAPRYNRPPWSSGFALQAHNDYLELFAETGVAGFALLACFFWQIGRGLYSGLRLHSPRALPVFAALAAALAAMAFHELFDFNLQIPANALLFTLLLALAVRLTLAAQIAKSQELQAQVWVSQEGNRDFEIGERRSVAGRSRSATREISARLTAAVIPLAICLICGTLFIAVLDQEAVPYPYNLTKPASVAEARKLIVSYPARASGHFFLAGLLEREAPPERPLEELRTALWLDPVSPHVRDLYAAALMQLGKKEEALQEVTASIVNSPVASSHFYLSGRLFHWLSPEEIAAVEAGFKKAMMEGYPGALDSLAQFYQKLGRFSDQGVLLEKAAASNTDAEAALNFLVNAGVAFARSGDEAKAEAVFRKAIAAAPGDQRAYGHLVTMVYGPRKNLAVAKEVVLTGIKNGVEPIPLYLALAEAAHKAGSPGDGKEALSLAKLEVEKVAKRGEDPYLLYRALADGAGNSGNREEERAALAKALEFRPRASDTLFRLAALYLHENNFDRSAYYFRRYVELNPDAAQGHYQLALAEAGQYRYAAAEQAYARAVELEPGDGDLRRQYDEFRRKVAQSGPKP